MFGNSFRLPNLLARTNKPGLFPVFSELCEYAQFRWHFFAITNTIFFYENIEYCRIQSYDYEYVFFSYICMFYLFIIIFLNDTR